MTPTPARPALPALTGLRALAALWVVLFRFDGINEGRHGDPALTTVAVDLGVLAGAAVDSLVRRLDDPSEPDGDSILVPHRLVVRGSTVRPRTTGGRPA